MVSQCAGHGTERNACKIVSGIFKGRGHLGKTRTVILKWILQSSSEGGQGIHVVRIGSSDGL